LGCKDGSEFETKTQFLLFTNLLLKSHFQLYFCQHGILTSKEWSLWNKIKHLNHNIFRTRCCKPLIFQTQIIWPNRIHNLKYLRSAKFGSKDIVIRKSEFVAKTQFLCLRKVWNFASFVVSYDLQNMLLIPRISRDQSWICK